MSSFYVLSDVFISVFTELKKFCIFHSVAKTEAVKLQESDTMNYHSRQTLFYTKKKINGLTLEIIEMAYYICIFTSIKRQMKGREWRGAWWECLTIQSGTPACSGHPSPSGPSSSCKRWDSPGCTGVRRDSVTGHQRAKTWSISLSTNAPSSIVSEVICGELL